MHGNTDRDKLMRRTLARLLNCSQVLVLRDISGAAKKRFPTMDHVVEAGMTLRNKKWSHLIASREYCSGIVLRILGFFTKEERDAYEKVDCPHHKYWVPIHWCYSLLNKAKKEGRIDDLGVITDVSH